MAIDYVTLRTIHQSAVALSIAGFALRFGAALAGAHWLRSRPARVLPQVVDTVLLAAALGMLWTAALNPLNQPWLLAKIAALPFYVGLGAVALRPAASLPLRLFAGLGALAAVGYIASVALLKTPLGFWSLLAR